MAISASTLTTTVSEAITLNGQTFGNTVTKSFSSIKDIFVRIIPVPSGSTITTLYTVGTTDTGSQFTPTSLKYARITNKDTANALSIFIDNEAGHEVLYKLDAGCSYIINLHEDSIMAETTTGTDLTGDNSATYAAGSAAITQVRAQAFNAAVDVEVFVAAT